MWHTDGTDVKSHSRIFRPSSIRIRIQGPDSVLGRGPAQEECDSITFNGALDPSPLIPRPKPDPVARRRAFPSIPIPDLSDFHALVVDVSEADGKTYALAVHPRDPPHSGTYGKDAVLGVNRSLVSWEHAFTVPEHNPLPEWATPTSTTVKLRLQFADFRPYYDNQPSNQSTVGPPLWSDIGSISLVHRSLNGMQSGPFSITVRCIQAVQYKPGLVHEAPQYLPPSETWPPQKSLESPSGSAERVNRTRQVFKRLSHTNLATKIRRTVRVLGGPDADIPPTTNPFIMDLGKLNFPRSRDWDDSAAAAGPSKSSWDGHTETGSVSAADASPNKSAWDEDTDTESVSEAAAGPSKSAWDGDT